MPHPIAPSRSEALLLHQRRYHVRHWGPEGAPKLFMLHGWMDSSATFQFLVEALGGGWHVIAPDWRGFGDTEWNDDSYYFPDYLADLDALLQHYSPETPVTLIGHSMGAMIAGIYAGVRPERLTRLVCIEGFGLPATHQEETPGRYARWLREQQNTPGYQPIGTLDEVAARLIERNPRLPPERAGFLAAALTCEVDGRLSYRADPRHKMVNPVLYRLEEAKACWRRIACPVLWVIGGDMWDHPMAKGVFATLDERRACFDQLDEVTVADAGHMIQWEQPERLAEALRAFLSA